MNVKVPADMSYELLEDGRHLVTRKRYPNGVMLRHFHFAEPKGDGEIEQILFELSEREPAHPGGLG